ncbi:MAG: hypothetical protein HY303_05675 [Candidatus Wallbacteria bacterium]|nr:hypothetical protein [Candidatus Wallbacteria bacterium]
MILPSREIHSSLAISTPTKGLALLLAGLLAAATASAQERLSREDLQRLYPAANLQELTPDELDTCLRSSQHLKLKKLLDAADKAKEQVAVDTGGPGAPVSEPSPSFEGLGNAAAKAATSLTDEQLTECFGADRFAHLGQARRDRWRTNATLLRFYGFYQSGRIKLPALQDIANNLLETERPPLVTKAGEPLRKQLPLEGNGFELGLNVSTGWAYVEKDRQKNQRDQQIANVYNALVDPDHESDVGEELALLGKLNSGKKIHIVLNLKMMHRGQIGTFDTFHVISLGMENPWLSPTQNLRYLRSVICHELGHYLQYLLYGWKPPVGPIARFAGLRHNPEVTTNEPVALSEGWGDFCGVTFGKSDYWDWQEGYRHEGYDEKKPLKSRKDLLRTEGIVTRVLLLSNERIAGFRQKVIATLGRHKPLSFAALVNGFSEDYPRESLPMRRALDETLKGSR